MRPEKNPLDLNNFPDDYSKQAFDESSSSAAAAGGGYRQKKNGANKDETGKVYECRFCSLKFCKSQALGGHMNRHRQERETEALNHARQLVFSSDNPAALGPPLGGCHPMAPSTYNIGDPFKSMYPPSRLFSGSSSALLPPPPLPPTHNSPYVYTSPSRPHPPYPSQFSQQGPNEYYVGHVFNSNNTSPTPYNPQQNMMSNSFNGLDCNSTYTCIGAPVIGHGIAGFRPAGLSRGSDQGSTGGGRDGSVSNTNEDGLNNWGTTRRFDHPPSINRFQDGF